jgi:HSP20 family protein
MEETMLTRFFDLNDTFSLMDAFERQMTRGFYDGGRAPQRRGGSSADLALRDEGDKLTLTASLPGFSKNDVDVSLEGDVLTLKAERKLEIPKDYKLVRRERETFEFTRQLELGVPVQADAVEATFEDGVLTVSLPKAPEAKPRKIPLTKRDEPREAVGSA